jgi:hypothetical protein
MTPDQELAYLAGILDGEGSFTYSHRKGRTRKNGSFGPAYTCAVVKCEMTDKDVILKLQRFFGGSMFPVKERLGHQPSWCWHIAGKSARAVMPRLLPFMSLRRSARIKQLQAGRFQPYNNVKQGNKESLLDTTNKQSYTDSMDQKFLDGADYGIKGYAEKNADSAPGLSKPISESADLTKGCRLSGCGGSEQTINSVQASSDTLRLISQGPGLDLSQESKRIDSPGATAKN